MNLIDVRETYNKLFELLDKTLSNLTTDDDSSKTVLKNWNVRDIIAHLAANSLQKTSAIKDYYSVNTTQKIYRNFDELSGIILINNEKWVELLKPMNISVLLNFLKFSYSGLLTEFGKIEKLDDPAVQNVRWAHT